MKIKILIAGILALSLLSVASAVNIPPSIRERNWGGGSCVHASIVMLFRYQRQYQMAEHWRRAYSGGETYAGLVSKLEANKVRWAGTYGSNDVKFLEWAIRTNRGCMVTTMKGAHMILLVSLDSKNAGLLDNNNPEKVYYIPRDQFLREWSEANSWGLTIVGVPPPPPLKREKDESIYVRSGHGLLGDYGLQLQKR